MNGYLTEQRGNLAWIIANAAPDNQLKINVQAANGRPNPADYGDSSLTIWQNALAERAGREGRREDGWTPRGLRSLALTSP